ncbi:MULTISPECIES: helix-turn-helix domain-containing protein [Amycolatopsis]|uniref:AraC family transcriptional regulator n=1 Tax=Amycolatopsis tucumanensis TaxID=401106 RepID=A0ABP7I3K8_9PSEU|nr:MULTISPECIES: helix-turn-helix domain-containing protein [Amycolatopsis]MCF6426182.1 AraC family transcriptional regulator [Amycolatopsis tucumanensis]
MADSYFRTRDLALARSAVEPIFGQHELRRTGEHVEIDMRMRTRSGTSAVSAMLTYGAPVIARLNTPRHAYVSLIVLQGRCMCRHSGAYLDVGPGGIVTVSPDQQFAIAPEADCLLKVARIEQHVMHGRLVRLAGFWPNDTITFSPEVALVADPGHTLATTVNRFFVGGRSRFARYADHVFVDWLLRNQSHEHSEATTEGERSVVGFETVNFVKLLMRTNPVADTTMSEYAAEAGTGLKDLLVAFERYEGCLPHEFLRGVRLDRVHALLLESGGGLREFTAALDRMGFRDNEQFQQWYLRRFGETPQQTQRRGSSV